jgi:L-threonylcarbamoyladenylate synthase
MTRSPLLHPFSETAVERAVAILRQGGIVAFPTETYYGLAVDPFNQEALSLLFVVKKRETRKPILTLVNSRKQLSQLVRDIPVPFQTLMDRFWPGPLTLVFEGVAGLPPLLTGHTNTVGIRQSSHPVARHLSSSFGSPITATSANISGYDPAVNAGEIANTFGTEIDMVIDGGTTPGGAGSTLVGIERGRLRLIRDGVIPFAEVAAAVS